MSRDFLSFVSDLKMLTPEVTEQVTVESRRTGEAPEALIARRGLLTAVQTDIVQTLLRPSDAVPGYELLGSLGYGGMGVVYRARQKTLDRIVAIKTILVGQINDQSIASRFEQEARAVAKLQHPHIISAIDFGQHDGRLFFVMEFVDGEDLEGLIDRQPQSDRGGSHSESFAWSLARQVAAGLSHAAEQGIVHRDIKPANLMLVAPPAGFPLPPGVPLVKIADFGLAFLATTEAEARTRLTSSNTTVGSPHYMAPEQLQGDPVDGRADIYALGATVFHLLAGRPPYRGLTLPQIMTRKITAEAPRLSSVREDVSEPTDSLIAAMMARNVEERIASYAELLDRIDGVCRSLNGAAPVEMTTGGMIQTWVAADVSGKALAAGSAKGPAAGALPLTSSRISELKTPHLKPCSTGKLSEPVDSGRFAITTAFPSPVPAIELPKVEEAQSPVASRRTSRRIALLALAGVAVVGSVGLVSWFAVLRPDAAPAQRQLVPSGWSEPLFDGRSLSQWQTRSGIWLITTDDDRARVLSGTNGVIARRLIRSDLQPPRRVTHFEITLAARQQAATAVELHFGLTRDSGDNGLRLTMRVEKETAWLATRAADRGPTVPLTPPVALVPLTADQPRVLRLVRDATHWFAFIGEQPLGVLPHTGQEELPEFRLVAESGPAWFSDIEVEELAAR